MSLWPFQQTDVGRLREAIAKHGSAIYKLPTGGGKTVVAAEIARLATDKGSRTLFLVHRRELVRQSVDTLTDACGGLIQIGVEAAGWPSMPWAPLQVASVQTLARRDHDIKPTLIVIDEAHHVRAATWETVLARWPNAKRIGLTATPERLDGRGLGAHFATMVDGPTIAELVAGNYLAPSRTLTLPSSLRLEGLRENSSGDYRITDLEDRVDENVIADAKDAYMRYARGKRAIFFGVHREHSRKVCEGLRELGIRAEHVDGTDSPARRDRVMRSFKTGGLEVVGNCDLVSEGTDFPECEVVILGRKTKSVTRYLQAAGRAMRYRPGKTALILDITGITYELGLPGEDREWSLEDGELKDRKKGKPMPRVCSECSTAFYGRTCPHCAHTEPMADVASVATELVDAKPRQPRSAPKLTRAALHRELAIAHRALDPRQAVREIGQRNGYSPRWATYILDLWGMA